MCAVGGFLCGNFDALRMLFEDPHISEYGNAYGFPFTVCRVGAFKERWDRLAVVGNLFCFAVVLVVVLRVLEGPVRQVIAGQEQGGADVSAPKKRAWFQLHLGTCVVLMLAASTLVWANVRIQIEVYANSWQKVNYETRGCPWPYQHSVTQYREWQLQVDEKFEQEYKISQVGLDPGPFELTISLERNIWRHPESWDKTHLAYNSLLALVLLAVLACGCEALICSRERKRASRSA